MIHICCGHEKSIGLEVLFKSFIKKDRFFLNSFCLHARKKDIELCLTQLKIKYAFLKDLLSFGNHLTLRVIVLDNNDKLPVTTASLNSIIQHLDNSNDILLTLPTSKDQLKIGPYSPAGYTEFLRKKYNINELCMYFKANDDHVLLITDHIPLNKVSSTITSELIYNKILLTLKAHDKYFYDFDEILIAGINPHAGENGILGDEDQVISKAIENLNEKLHINIKGPLSGDTLHFHEKENLKQLKVYMYHDQGLVAFKARNGILGLNITLGLPFLRISVDHGTAFDIFGKNIADESGCLYMIDQAYISHGNLNQE